MLKQKQNNTKKNEKDQKLNMKNLKNFFNLQSDCQIFKAKVNEMHCGLYIN